ncbi:MAG TPA: hypothetical protein PLN94_08840, partial [Thiolinea sp.]|nr:hypothetical protein [Thiolinea sp.]
MKINEQWLREWINPALDFEAIGERLTASGCEVEGLEPVATDFSGVVVGHIVSIARHPDADRLNVCEVDYGQEPLLQIV